MTQEIFAKPCVGAIIEKQVEGEKYILVQTRQKEDGEETNGMVEIPAGKIREYEDIFSALRREVREETGLEVTRIQGEEDMVSSQVGGVTTISFEPYCVTQNLSGAYSIILNTFRCEAEGDLLNSTNETQNIRWVSVSEVERLVDEHPDKVFFMHLNALRKYLREQTLLDKKSVRPLANYADIKLCRPTFAHEEQVMQDHEDGLSPNQREC